jgi:hypothetical protein
LMGGKLYGERHWKVVIARTPHLMRGTKQSLEIATLRPEHHAVQGFARNDSSVDVNLFMKFTINASGLIRLPEGFVWKQQVFDIIRARLIDSYSWVCTIAIFIAGEVSGQPLDVFRGIKSIP